MSYDFLFFITHVVAAIFCFELNRNMLGSLCLTWIKWDWKWLIFYINRFYVELTTYLCHRLNTSLAKRPWVKLGREFVIHYASNFHFELCLIEHTLTEANYDWIFRLLEKTCITNVTGKYWKSGISQVTLIRAPLSTKQKHKVRQAYLYLLKCYLFVLTLI